jgi:hypothetical protein
MSTSNENRWIISSASPWSTFAHGTFFLREAMNRPSNSTTVRCPFTGVGRSGLTAAGV